MSTGSQIARAAIKQQTVIPQRTAKEKASERAFALAMYAALALAFITLGALFYDFISDGAGEITGDFFANQPSKVNPESSGLQSALVGTLWLMAICAVIVVPLGVATAVYLEEYADNSRWWNRMIEVNIQNLASVPSVVYGILGLAFIVRGPLAMGPIVIAGSITLALLVLPVVIIVAREAIRAVPPSIREGSLALGATKWQTIWKQVLPGSVAGIATGVILALSRAVG
ncbi:MAG: phosphate ABC transporter permease PstA, partial [Solirubrobacteraceae bacterium]